MFIVLTEHLSETNLRSSNVCLLNAAVCLHKAYIVKYALKQHMAMTNIVLTSNNTLCLYQLYINTKYNSNKI